MVKGGRLLEAAKKVIQLPTLHLEKPVMVVVAPVEKGLVGTLSYQSDFDKNGALYYIATNGGNQQYKNPHDSGLVAVTASYWNPTHGRPSKFVENVHSSNVYNFTNDVANSWMAVDLKEYECWLSRYSLRSD